MKGFLEMKKRASQDNRGIALVSVLIIITLCFLLSGAIMQVSYMALLSRNVSTASANNFYDAEAVVDDMKIELQAVAAAALQVSGSQNTAAYVTQVYNSLTAGTSPNILENVQTNLATYADMPGASITIDLVNGGIEKGSDYVLIKGVTVEYTDPDTGYYSQITTDIRVNAPYYASSENVSLGSYSSLVGSGAVMYSEESFQNKKPGYMLQEGNVYFGTMADSSLALWLHNYVTLELEGDNVVINGDVYVDNHSTLKFTGGGAVEVRGTIYLNNCSHLVIASDTYLLCKDIVVDNKYIAGNTTSGYYSNGSYNAGGLSGQYQNVVSGTAYSRYLPYQYDPFNSYREELVPNIGSMASGLLILDKADNNCYALMTQGTDFTYQRAGGSETVEFELISNPSSPAGNQGIYFDSTVAVASKIAFTAYNGQQYQIDDQIYKFLNVSYLTYISQDSNARQIRRKVTSYEEKIVSAVTDPRNLEALRTVDTNTTLYAATSDLVDADELTLNYQGVTYTGAVKNDDGCVFGRSQDSYNPSAGTFLSLFFCVNPYTVEFNKGTDYLGIFMSFDRVNYKVKWGSVKGRSILSSPNEQDIDNVKEYVEKLSYYVVGQNPPAYYALNQSVPENDIRNKQYAYTCLVNNMFIGGWESLFEGEHASTVVDTSQNENLNLIELENWNKN